MVETADAIAYLHSRDPPVIHKDIKPDNILISSDFCALLGDFALTVAEGLTRRVSHWRSPELLLGHPCTSASDIYAFGMTISEVCNKMLLSCDTVRIIKILRR